MFRLSAAQRASLLTFWQTTLHGGALAFAWTHPINGAAISCRIVEAPTFEPVAGGRFWNAALSIEVLPNTSKEVIALLRGLASPPSVTLQIVRSADPNVVEREWVGIEWRASTYDLGTITGTLTVDDLATEEFPYVTFDGRFKGLWP